VYHSYVHTNDSILALIVANAVSAMDSTVIMRMVQNTELDILVTIVDSITFDDGTTYVSFVHDNDSILSLISANSVDSAGAVSAIENAELDILFLAVDSVTFDDGSTYTSYIHTNDSILSMIATMGCIDTVETHEFSSLFADTVFFVHSQDFITSDGSALKFWAEGAYMMQHLQGTYSILNLDVINLTTVAAAPGLPADGMIYYHATDEKFYGRIDGAWVDMGGTTPADTLKSASLICTTDSISESTDSLKLGLVITPNMDGLDLVDMQVSSLNNADRVVSVDVYRIRGATTVCMTTTEATLGAEYTVSDEVINTTYDDVNAGDIIYLKWSQAAGTTRHYCLMVGLDFE